MGWANRVTEDYHVDDGDKLTSITQGLATVKSFTYDAQGRTTGITTASGTTTMSYDYEDRITGIAYPSSATNSFGYNAFDTRVSKSDSAGTATLMRDGVGVTAQVLSDGSSSFTPGVSQRSGATSTFQAMDRLGTFRVETNASQSVTGTRTYDAFGNPTATTGTPATPFGFAGAWGYQQDPDSGLMLLGHRYYDPSTGRFLTRDAAKDGRNWCAYCRGNPLNSIDPCGTRTFIGVKIEANFILGVNIQIGVETTDDGGYSITGSGDLQIGPNVGFGAGPTFQKLPTYDDGNLEPQQGWAMIHPFQEIEDDYGPLEVHLHNDGQDKNVTWGLTPFQVEGGCAASLIGASWHSGTFGQGHGDGGSPDPTAILPSVDKFKQFYGLPTVD